MRRVTFHSTCLGAGFFSQACADAVRLLERLGCEVSLAPGRTCCGQPAYSLGHLREAASVATHTAETLTDRSGAVVLPSGSCAAMVRRGYPELLGQRAETLSNRTFELCEFVARLIAERGGEGGGQVASCAASEEDGERATGPLADGEGLEEMRVAYHHGCHALRELGIRSQPVELLKGLGAEVVEWEAEEECCGFGGLFATSFPEVSGAMADRKLDSLPAVDAVVSSEPGCLLQLGGRLDRRGRKIPVFHVASLLREGMTGRAS